MVCREVRETGRGTSRTGPSGRLYGYLACRPPQSRRFSLDTGRRSHPKSKCSVYNLRQETPEISQKSPSNEYHTEHFT